MSIKHWGAGRWLIGFVAFCALVTPYLADWSKTHLFNPTWPGHAKFHVAQTILMGTVTGAISLVFLTRKSDTPEERKHDLQLSVLFGALYWLTQAGSILFPGATYFTPEEERLVPTIAGIRPNQTYLDGFMLALLAAAYRLAARKPDRAA